MIKMSIDEFLDRALFACQDWQKRFLNITQKELDRLWEEETLSVLHSRLTDTYLQMPEEELQKFIDELEELTTDFWVCNNL